MTYVPVTWIEKVTKVGPTNLNHLELGVQAAAAVADAALPTPAGTNGQFLKRVGGVWVPTSFAASDIPSYPSDVAKTLRGDGTWAEPVVVSTSPSNPTGTTSTATYKMMGLALAFTPALTGRILVALSGMLQSDTTGDAASGHLAYGTGTAPANAASATGTSVGNEAQHTRSSGNDGGDSFICHAIIAGLSIGTAYWIDLALKAVTGGTATALNLHADIIEV